MKIETVAQPCYSSIDPAQKSADFTKTQQPLNVPASSSERMSGLLRGL